MKLRNIGKAYRDSERTARKTGWSEDASSYESWQEYQKYGTEKEKVKAH